MTNLKEEFQWYLQNQDDLVAQYEGRYLVIKDKKILGVFDNDMDAIRQTMLNHELGTFLVQICSSDPHSTSAIFRSRARF